MDTTALTIGRAASASGVPVKTIRYYEEIGLIPRARRGNGAARTGGNRIYDAESVGRLRFIRDARRLGLSLGDIRELLRIAETKGCPSQHAEYRATLLRHLESVEERLDQLSSLSAILRRLLSRKGDAMRGQCVWTTCACMTPSTIAADPIGSRPLRNRNPTASRGGMTKGKR